MTKGERIKHRRKELGISQTELAKQIGVSKQTLYKYEKDIVSNIPSDIIEKLASKLYCPPDYIMGWKKPVDDSEPKRIYAIKTSTHLTVNPLEEDLLNLFRKNIKFRRTVNDLIDIFKKEEGEK